MSILGHQAMLMASSGPPVDAYALAVMADNPVAWWRLNGAVTNGGTAPDASGNGHPATFTVGSADAAAQPGPSLVTGSPSSYAKTGANPGGAVAGSMPAFSGSYSVVAWFKTGDTGANRQIIAIDDESSQRLFQLRLGGGTPLFIQIRGGVTAIGGSTSLADNVRHLLVATVDVTTSTNNVLMYADGPLIATGSVNASGSASAPACIGCYRDNSAHPDYQFVGSIADVAIFDKVLTPDRVAAYWAAGQ